MEEREKMEENEFIGIAVRASDVMFHPIEDDEKDKTEKEVVFLRLKKGEKTLNSAVESLSHHPLYEKSSTPREKYKCAASKYSPEDRVFTVYADIAEKVFSAPTSTHSLLSMVLLLPVLMEYYKEYQQAIDPFGEPDPPVFHPGEKVTYVTEYKKEHGIVKRARDPEHYFVVYNCGEDWENYKNYTAACTDVSSLVKGWIDLERESIGEMALH